MNALKTSGFGLTDVGRRRDSNEDEFRLVEELGLFAVADGMGGHAAGEVASRLAMDTVVETIRKAGPATIDALQATELVRRAIDEANRRICESIQDNEDQRGMGTTIAALLRVGDQAIIGHVGDSRVYLLRDGGLQRLTSDHSWVNEQVKLGLLSEEAAQRHPMRNIVTRALGSRNDVLVDVAIEKILPGDLFVVCSDGLNTMLEDDEIRDTLLENGASPEQACQALVEAANDRGGEDNVTVVVVAAQ